MIAQTVEEALAIFERCSILIEDIMATRLENYQPIYKDYDYNRLGKYRMFHFWESDTLVATFHADLVAPLSGWQETSVKMTMAELRPLLGDDFETFEAVCHHFAFFGSANRDDGYFRLDSPYWRAGWADREAFAIEHWSRQQHDAHTAADITYDPGAAPYTLESTTHIFGYAVGA